MRRPMKVNKKIRKPLGLWWIEPIEETIRERGLIPYKHVPPGPRPKFGPGPKPVITRIDSSDPGETLRGVKRSQGRRRRPMPSLGPIPCPGPGATAARLRPHQAQTVLGTSTGRAWGDVDSCVKGSLDEAPTPSYRLGPCRAGDIVVRHVESHPGVA